MLRNLKEGSSLDSFINLFYIRNIFVEKQGEGMARD